jgi:hypothetical protein
VASAPGSAVVAAISPPREPPTSTPDIARWPMSTAAHRACGASVRACDACA